MRAIAIILILVMLPGILAADDLKGMVTELTNVYESRLRNKDEKIKAQQEIIDVQDQRNEKQKEYVDHLEKREKRARARETIKDIIIAIFTLAGLIAGGRAAIGK